MSSSFFLADLIILASYIIIQERRARSGCYSFYNKVADLVSFVKPLMFSEFSAQLIAYKISVIHKTITLSFKSYFTRESIIFPRYK